MHLFSEQSRLRAARRLVERIGALMELPFSVRLWDGTTIPRAEEGAGDFTLSFRDPDVIGSLIRKPTYENLLLQYAQGHIDLGEDLLDFLVAVRGKKRKSRLKKSNFLPLLKDALPLLFTPARRLAATPRYRDEETGRRQSLRNNREFIQFHYDISNDFYALFLGAEMQYSCAYFTDPEGSLDQAQHDKLEMICRKLRLKPGERLLDIGCGWGGLICHAARHYGVRAHGITLSEQQYNYARKKIQEMGLGDRVSVELKDYAAVQGSYDKMASVGMFEHIGIANMPHYFQTMGRLLRDRGIFLNHGIARRAKATRRAVRRIRPERRLLLKYVFPGSELDNVGHTIDLMEMHGFEVHDVEAWREHYGLTTKHWYRGLMAHREEAIRLVGEERFRLWGLYLAGVSLGFTDGSMHIYQVVATKHAAKGSSGLPLTREDLYRSG